MQGFRAFKVDKKWYQSDSSGVYFVDFEHIQFIILVILFVTLSM